MSKTTTAPADWKEELDATAYKYHLLIAQVGLVLNIIFALGDYYNSPLHFIDFLIFRVVVSLLTLFIVLNKNKFVHWPAIIVLVPVLGISIQNAYMYSMLEGAEFQKHTLAYIALFIAAGMFILWKPIYSIIVVIITIIANVVLFQMNSPLSLSDILINGGLLTLTVALLSIIQINSRNNLTKKEIVARLALAESNNQMAIKNIIIEEKNKDIRDSINYALNIQRAILPPLSKIDNVLKDYFIFYKPKDIVSGDFYWFDSKLTTPRAGQPAQEVVAIAAVDCTGHGVPGALMSVIGSTILNQTINRATVNNSGDALSFFNKKVAETLDTIKDGMDMSLCVINIEKMELQYAGANNPIYIVRNSENGPLKIENGRVKEKQISEVTVEEEVMKSVESIVFEKLLIEVKADKQAIGADTKEVKIFTNNIIKLEKGDSLYMFTDGYADQFGGPKGKKFKYGKFKELLLEIQHESMKKQQEILKNRFEEWRGSLEQVDDILVIGIKV
ncbi:MAG: SpoIIE family protein phosphatase [Bacteroidota bacterium]